MVDDESSQKPKFGAKSDFVRSLDPALPAGQVVALAQQRGLKLTTGFVYNIRSTANGRANGAKARSPRAAPKPSSAESLLRAAIAEVGLARARQILEEVEATFAGLR
jgi:hypothetical protein